MIHKSLALFLIATVMVFAVVQPLAAKPVNFASNTPTLSGTLPLVVAQEFGFFAGSKGRARRIGGNLTRTQA